MSDNISLDEVNEKLSAVILQVQEGKTTVCINYITSDISNDIHLIFTMNTLKSGMQFFGRLKKDVDSKNIIVFNSKPSTAEDCHHAKNPGEIIALLRKYPTIKVIVCCAHEKRFKKSIHELFDCISDSTVLSRRKFKIHVDEGHVYIKQNRDDIVLFNSNPFVKSIIGYSGTPYPMWGGVRDDPLFHKIHIRDIREELGIIRSNEYFGSNKCEFFIMEEQIDVNSLSFDTVIPNVVLIRAKSSKESDLFYTDGYYFNLGNEVVLFGYLDYILPTLHIDQNTFSYHFAPAYIRLVSQYQVVEIILKHYPTSNVIVSNGNGMELYRINPETKMSYRVLVDKQILLGATLDEIKKLNEPSYMIQQLIKKTPNFPTFITGFKCVEMSVTLVNEEIGNFDTCIMAHQHFDKEKLRQLCRFNFNFKNWSPDNKAKIKTTKFFSLTKSVTDIILKYEEDVERMNSDFAGKTCSLREIQGLEPEELSLREIKRNELMSVIITNGELWKKFKVWDGNDDEQWNKASLFYESIRNKELKGRSKPTLINGFWCCTTTKAGGREKQSARTITNMKNQNWWSTFQLVQEQLTYARVFVGYEDIEDPSEYTIFIKYVVIDETCKEIINKYSPTRNSILEESDSD